MVDVTKELIYNLVRQIQCDIADVNELLREINAGLNALLTQTIAVQQDIHNIYSILARHDARPERIGRRLGIVEEA
jgi:hypothetical protein